MHETSSLIGVVADILAIVGIIYVVLQIRRSERKIKKSQLAVKFERFKREKMLRNALVILMLSFIFSFFTVYGFILHPESSGEEKHSLITETTYVISKILLFIFVVYVLQTTRYAKVSTKGI